VRAARVHDSFFFLRERERERWIGEITPRWESLYNFKTVKLFNCSSSPTTMGVVGESDETLSPLELRRKHETPKVCRV
jgi:hypothetical protein